MAEHARLRDVLSNYGRADIDVQYVRRIREGEVLRRRPDTGAACRTLQRCDRGAEADAAKQELLAGRANAIALLNR